MHPNQNMYVGVVYYVCLLDVNMKPTSAYKGQKNKDPIPLGSHDPHLHSVGIPDTSSAIVITNG